MNSLNKKILIISNFENTLFYHRLFNNYFDKKNIFWCVVNNKNYLFLRDFYFKENILYANKNFINNQLYDSDSQEIKINEILYADRFLKKDLKNLLYINNFSSIIKKFLIKKKIGIIFGEFTWAHELAASRIAKKVGILYFNIQSTRYPSNRFLFFSNERQNEFFLRKKKEKKIVFFENANLYERYIIKKKREKYSFYNKINKFYNLFFNDYYDKLDPCYISKLKRVINFIKKYYNCILYYSLKKKNFLNINKKYIIYFLQKQPEASIDVKGIYYSDHLKNIQNIWRVLPNNFQLIIKEHPNCIGDRSLSFYKSFLKLPNIFLSDNKYENKLLKSAIATISVASTASLKTALLQIPSFTFAETFFNCLDFSARISLDEMRNCKNFFELLNKKFLNKKSNNINFYLENSFEGTIIPEKLNDKNNLNKIRKALIEVVNK
jgi:hypothetical protein